MKLRLGCQPVFFRQPAHMLGADVVGQGVELIPVGMMEHESFFLDTLGIPVPVEKVHCRRLMAGSDLSDRRV